MKPSALLRTTIATTLALPALLALSAPTSARAEAAVGPGVGFVQWVFRDQDDTRITLAVETADAATTWSQGVRLRALVATPPRTGLALADGDLAPHIRIHSPEPMRQVDLTCVEILDEAALARRVRAHGEPLEVAFLIERSADGDAPQPAPPAKSTFPPEADYRRLIDGTALNAPVPEGWYYTPAPDPDLAGGAPAWPFEWGTALRIDFAPTDGWVRMALADLPDRLVIDDPDQPEAALQVWAGGGALETRLAPAIDHPPIEKDADGANDVTAPALYFRAPAPEAPWMALVRVFVVRARGDGDAPPAGSAHGAQGGATPAGAAGAAMPAEWVEMSALSPQAALVTPGPWEFAETGADILYITTSSFRDALAPLVRHREAQGYRAAVVDVEDIALRYGAGAPRPQAIRAFCADAFAHWAPPAPAYLVLVGDASTNFTDPDPSLVRNQVPSFYEGVPSPTDPSADNVPANDNAFSCFLGRGVYPALLTGRLAVRETWELADVVKKIVAYEAPDAVGPWRGRSLWMIDAGYDHLFTDEVAGPQPGPTPRRLAVGDYPLMDHYAIADEKISPDCNRDMLDHMSSGYHVMRYAGHGGVTLLSRQKVFFHKDVDRLQNDDMPAFCVQISCNTGCFDFPVAEYSASIAELLLRKRSGGAIGVVAASRYLGGDEFALHQGVSHGLYDQPRTTLGLISARAQSHLIRAQGGVRGVFADSYNLLGDPATLFRLPADDLALTAATEGPLRMAQGATLTVTVRADEAAPTSAADDLEVAIKALDDKGHAMATALTRLRDGAAATTVTLPQGFLSPSITLAAYAGNPDSGWEARGELTLPVEPYLLPGAPESPEAQITFVPRSLNVRGRASEYVDGETIFFDVYVVNVGGAPSGPFTVGLVQRRESEGPEENRVRDTVEAPGLVPREIQPVRLRYDDFDTEGTHLFRLALDGDDVAQPVPGGEFRLTVLPKPDLTLTEQDVRVTWHPSGALQVALTVRNVGGSATGPTYAQLFCALPDGRIQSISPLIPTPPAPAGATVRIAPFLAPVPRGLAPPLRLLARVDVTQEHTEQNEENNFAMVVLGEDGDVPEPSAKVNAHLFVD